MLAKKKTILGAASLYSYCILYVLCTVLYVVYINIYLSVDVSRAPCLCWFAVPCPWFGLLPPFILIYILNIRCSIQYCMSTSYKLAAPRIVFFFGQHLSRDYWPPGHENPAMGFFWGVDHH